MDPAELQHKAIQILEVHQLQSQGSTSETQNLLQDELRSSTQQQTADAGDGGGRGIAAGWNADAELKPSRRSHWDTVRADLNKRVSWRMCNCGAPCTACCAGAVSNTQCLLP